MQSRLTAWTAVAGNGVSRWMVASATLGALLAALATMYGFLEGGGRRPSLKLWGAIVLAIAGAAVVLLARAARLQGRDDRAVTSPSPTVGHVIRFAVAALSMGAALIHFAVIRQHWVEYWLYGTFFGLVALAQLGWALLVVARPSRLVYLAGALGNASIVVLWVITRTIGAMIGPEANEPAEMGFGDAAATAFEALIVIGALVLLRRAVEQRRVHMATAEFLSAMVLLVLTGLTLLGLFSAVGGAPFVPPVG